MDNPETGPETTSSEVPLDQSPSEVPEPSIADATPPGVEPYESTSFAREADPLTTGTPVWDAAHRDSADLSSRGTASDGGGATQAEVQSRTEMPATVDENNYDQVAAYRDYPDLPGNEGVDPPADESQESGRSDREDSRGQSGSAGGAQGGGQGEPSRGAQADAQPTRSACAPDPAETALKPAQDKALVLQPPRPRGRGLGL
jgi:hypothetical protein